MDKIQKILVEAGRKDLAQEYYKKISGILWDVNARLPKDAKEGEWYHFRETASYYEVIKERGHLKFDGGHVLLPNNVNEDNVKELTVRSSSFKVQRKRSISYLNHRSLHEANFKDFTDNDRRSYSGTEKYPDGSEPRIAEIKVEATVIADGQGMLFQIVGQNTLQSNDEKDKKRQEAILKQVQEGLADVDDLFPDRAH